MRAGAALCLLATLAMLASVSVEASTGVVIDPQGDPLADVKVCYIIGGAENLCVQSDSNGSWSLPKSGVDTVRLTLSGFLPLEIDGGDQGEPVILHPAATLIVRLEGPDGKAISAGEFDVVYSNGTRYGPFPIRNAVGTKIRTLEPGPVAIVGRAAGFAETRAKEDELTSGEEVVAVIRLQPAKR